MLNEIMRLQQAVDRRLGLERSERGGTRLNRAQMTMGALALIDFDKQHFPKLLQESKRLSAGAGFVSDASVPAIWQRTVIREALYRLNALQFTDAATAAFGSSLEIPYSYRDNTAAGRTNTRIYEGEEIPRSGVIQTAELAYPLPQKISFELSDELRYITSSQSLDWDAVIENLSNSARLIAEDTDRTVLNEMLLSSDEYGAVAVSGENLELQADDVDAVFILAHFPVVRPRTIRDLQGNIVGNIVNPVTVSYNSVAVGEYDGTGTQAPGIYYSLNYNLGEIHLVDESGALLIPADGTAYTISYSYATNVYAFDTDEGTDELDVHWDKFLYRYALRKNEIESARYHSCDFGLMSGTVQNHIESAKTFAANFRKPGTDLDSTGTLGLIKGVPNWKTTGPGLFYRDERVLLGELGITRFRLLKGWEPSTLTAERGPNGRFTGKKSAYGDQWIIVHTPTQLKRAFTSMVLYSSPMRVARATP